MNIFQTVKEAVTAKDVAMYYGIRVNRSNMACCPFHDDHHPSMKVDKGFICFACGEKGDVITFVSKLFGLSPYEAAKKIAADFNVPVPDSNAKYKSSYKANGSGMKRKSKKDSPKSPQQKQMEMEREFERWRQKCIIILSDYLHLLEDWRGQFAPKEGDDDWDEHFTEALSKQTVIEYYLDVLLTGTLEDQLQFMADKGEGVIRLEKRMEQYRRGNQEAGGFRDGSYEPAA
ncbi:MAG: CHC2 zinc finger domain-containing protein [Lachnospiraceae bacterium]|nr:CHC2 zinc finger domain-containing protein [Lachnospiraceae bacterium]